MQNEYIDQWQSLGKDAFESVRELERIGSRTMERLTAQNLELINAWFETGVKQASLLNGSRDYKDVVSNQMELASGLGTQVVENARKTADIVNEMRNDLTQWYETKLNRAAEVAKKVPVQQAA